MFRYTYLALLIFFATTETVCHAGIIAVAGSVFPNVSRGDAAAEARSSVIDKFPLARHSDVSTSYAYGRDDFGVGIFEYDSISTPSPLTIKLSATAQGGSKIVDADAEVIVRKRFQVKSKNGDPIPDDGFLGVPTMTFQMSIDGRFSNRLLPDEFPQFAPPLSETRPYGHAFLTFDNQAPLPPFVPDLYDFDADGDGNRFDPVFSPITQRFQTDTGDFVWQTSDLHQPRSPRLIDSKVIRPGPNYYDFYDPDPKATSWTIDVAGNPNYNKKPYLYVEAPIINGIGYLDFTVRVGATALPYNRFSANFEHTISVEDFSIDGFGAMSNPSGFASRYEVNFLADVGAGSVVPEPSSAAIFGIGILGLLMRRRTPSSTYNKTAGTGK